MSSSNQMIDESALSYVEDEGQENSEVPQVNEKIGRLLRRRF
jgi:hypothetical protein